MRGVLSVSGVIGTWAGPRSPGTAYVMAHHKIGDVGDGKLGAWGFPEGGMGGVTARCAAAAELRRRRPHRPAGRADLVARRRGAASSLRPGEELAAPTSSSRPRIRRSRSCATRPPRAPRRLRRRPRALEVAQRHRQGQPRARSAARVHGQPGFDPDVHGGTIVLAPSLDAVEPRSRTPSPAGPPPRRSPTSASRRCSIRRSRRRAST